MRNLVVAMDGPAGAGKSTVARLVAQKLKYTYIDTGAMYRAVAWKVLQQTKPPVANEKILSALQGFSVRLQYVNGKMKIWVDDQDVSEAIRTPEVTALVSQVAKVGEVREKMVVLQQKMAVGGGVVMDGRDICTHVLPNADVKIFLTASIEERARRRWKQMQNKGYQIDLRQLQKEIADRDKADSEREISPLVQAKDAVLLDTTSLTVDEAVQAVIHLCERA